MLERLPIAALLVLAVSSALAPAGAVLLGARLPPPTEWRGGMILRGTLHDDRFVIAQWWPERGRLDVVFGGEFPDTVCEGVAVAIEGRMIGDHFEAEYVRADRSKYDPCWEWQCRPDHERPVRCRDRRFE